MRTAHIEQELQTYMIKIIHSNCTECKPLTTSSFRKGLFLCHSNPTTTTYRTTLVNLFPATNSTDMVGIIQSWVSDGASLVLDGLLVRLSQTCPVSISRLDVGECDSRVRTGTGLGERITQTLNECTVRHLGEEICSL